MWHTERAAKCLQLSMLLAAGYLASRDVDRTMRQRPMTAEQTHELQALVAQATTTELREQPR